MSPSEFLVIGFQGGYFFIFLCLPPKATPILPEPYLLVVPAVGWPERDRTGIGIVQPSSEGMTSIPVSWLTRCDYPLKFV